MLLRVLPLDSLTISDLSVASSSDRGKETQLWLPPQSLWHLLMCIGLQGAPLPRLPAAGRTRVPSLWLIPVWVLTSVYMYTLVMQAITEPLSRWECQEVPARSS
jgi:hypothetical protein